jgi:hypothetical protein
MSEAAVICETSRRPLHSFRPATPTRGQTADYGSGALGLAFPRLSTPPKTRSLPELWIVGVSNDSADHGTTAHLLARIQA